MAWTCALTGKSELTFQEAVDSEAAAQSSLQTVSPGLQRAMLFIAGYITATTTTKFNDICHFLWAYTSCRFFVNEEVEVMHHNEKKMAKIVKVVPPSRATWESLSDVCFGADPSGFKYDVMSSSQSKKPFRMICPADRISRPKGNLTKDRVKLFMKQHSDTYKRQTITELKEQSVKSYKLDRLKWEEVFAGPLPSLDPEDESLPTRIRNKHRVSASLAADKPDRRKQSFGSEKKTKPGPKPHGPEEKKLRLEEQRKRQLEKKRLAREKAREEKLKHAKLQAEWSRKREDLECDDLKPLPSGFPVHCSIPNALFGDAVTIMEFYHNFDEFFDLKEIFPHGFTFDLLQRILCEKSIKSPVSDLIRITLATIFCLQEEEEAEDKKDDKKESEVVFFVEEAVADDDEVGGDDLRTAMNQALKVQNVLKRVHGPKMSTMELTPLTVSEVLRLHLLTSGAPRTRSVYRGWFFAREDPGLLFRIERPDVIEKLSKTSVYELEVDEKIGIFHALMNQVMSFPAFRSIMEATIDMIVDVRKEMRSAQADFGRWERENAVRKTRKEGDADGGNAPPETTPEETEQAVAAVTAEREKRQFALEKEQADRRQKIRKYEAQYGMKAIGRDRAFRRYWIFNSIAGLFIEQDDPFTGPCVRSHDSGNMKSLSCSPTNNKENEFGEKSDRSSNGSVSSNHSSMTCTGNSSCLIHSCHPSLKYKWRFIVNPEEVQQLIDCLNQRGFRESELGQALKTDLRLYEKTIADCPVGKLNTDIPTESRRENARLVYYKASMSGMSHIEKEPDVALKMMFLDHLSSFEEQLFLSGLSFRANSCISRDEWKCYFQYMEPSKPDFIGRVTKALSRLGSVIPETQLRDDWLIAKWNECVEETSSISRLFFLLSVLESKIDFPQNVSSYCRLCRRKKDAESMLLCDSCNRGHHTYCLKPPLDDVPKGKWFCPKCEQVPKVPKSPHKPVNRADDDDIDDIETMESSQPSSRLTTDIDSDDSDDATEPDSDDDDLCAVCGSADDEPDVECSRCSRKYHISCHVPKIPGSTRNWLCCKCAPVRGVQSKRKEPEPLIESDSGRPKRTRIALKNTAFGQTQTTSEKGRTSSRSTRNSDDDGYNHVLCHKILAKLREHESGWPFLRRPTSRDVSFPFSH